MDPHILDLHSLSLSFAHSAQAPALDSGHNSNYVLAPLIIMWPRLHQHNRGYVRLFVAMLIVLFPTDSIPHCLFHIPCSS